MNAMVDNGRKVVLEENIEAKVETDGIDVEMVITTREVDFVMEVVPFEDTIQIVSQEVKEYGSEVIQNDGWENVLQKVVFEDNGESHERCAQQHGVVEIFLNPSGNIKVSKVLVCGACPNRKDDLGDEAMDEVLEQDRSDKIEMDVLDVIEDEIEDPDDNNVEHVAVGIDRKQREDVEVVGGSGISGNRWNRYVCSVVGRCVVVTVVRSRLWAGS